MKRVLRNGLIGFLFCAALTPVVSMAMQNNEESGLLAKTGKFAVISTVAYTISENLTYDSLKNGMEKVKTGAAWVGSGLKAISWDYGIKGAWENPLPTFGITGIISGIKIMGNEIRAEKRNNGMFSLGSAMMVMGCFCTAAHWDLINKILGANKSTQNV